jgi:hypothetical protein
MAAKKPAPATPGQAQNVPKPTPRKVAASAQAPDAPKPRPTAARATKRDVAREAALVRQTLAAMAAIPDDPPGTDQAVMRAIDEERPGRPLFKGLY